MTSSSVSFRITRNTHDLAETIHALSQRLVSLEQRLAAMEGELAAREQEDEEVDPDQLESLESVERLLRDCRDLLEEEVGADDQPIGVRSQEPASQPRDGYPAAA
jgi:predicted  nucleic acid-binding Zn-ribbon protein